MIKPKKKSPKAQPVRMTIKESNLQQTISPQVTDLQEISFHGVPPVMFVTIGPVLLSDDTTNNQICDGQITLQIGSAIVTPVFFAMITRLLTPFKGAFSMQLYGNIKTQNRQGVTVEVDSILLIRILAAQSKK